MTKKNLLGSFLKQLSSEVDRGSEAVAKIGDLPPVPGQPATANIPGVGKVDLGGSKSIQESAQKVTEAKGLDYNPPKDYVKADSATGARAAEDYELMKHDPTNPEVHRAYQALADETVAMYEQMLEDGINPYFIGAKDPYEASPYLSLLDLSQNKSLGVFPTKSGFGTDEGFDPSSSPLLQDSGYKINGQPALINDLFRAVHDYYGHGSKGVGFRASGERNAFLEHFSMFGPLARRAAASETHGQNSWLNFGPNAGVNQNAKIGDTIFADQKTGLMSNQIIMEGTEEAKKRQKKIEQILAGDDRGFEGALGKDGSFELVHYSKDPLDVVDPKMQHTGLGKKSIAEVNRLSDTRAPKRSSFGIEATDRPYKREQGLGEIKNKVRIPASQMYDLVNDPDNLKASIPIKEYGSPQELATLTERAIKEAGYTGFFTKHPSLGAVAQLFDPVKTAGKKLASALIPFGGTGAAGALATLYTLSESRQADASILPTLAEQAAKAMKGKFSGTAITLGKEEVAQKFSALNRPDAILPNRALYAMGYITDESILKNINNPKALQDYIKKRESALLKDLRDRPGVASKYDLMAQNDFADVYKKLERAETPVVDPEYMKDKVITSTMTDLSGTVKTEMVGGIPTQKEHHGGTGFTSLMENVRKEIGWASDEQAMKTKSGQIDRIEQDTGKKAVLSPTGMSGTGINYISPLSGMLAEQTQQIKLPKSVKNAFDRTFRKNNPDWVGIDDPRAVEQISGDDVEGAVPLSPDARKEFVAMMGSGALQKLGFPSYANAVRVLSKKGFADLELGEGRKFMVPKSGGPQKNIMLGVGNDTYNAGLLLSQSEMPFFQLAENIPADIMFRDQYKKMSQEMSKGKGTPRPLKHSEIVNKIQTMNDIYQEVDDEWIESVTNHIKQKAKGRKGERGSANTPMMMMTSLLGGLGLMAASDDAESSVFKSLLTEAVKNLPMKKGNVDQMINTIKKGKGISKKELDMIDWEAWGDYKFDDVATKEQLGQFIEDQRPRVGLAELPEARSRAHDLSKFYDDEWNDGTETFYDIVSNLDEDFAVDTVIPLLDKIAVERYGMTPKKGLYSDTSGAWEDMRTDQLKDFPEDAHEKIKKHYLEGNSRHWLRERADFFDAEEGVTGPGFSEMILNSPNRDAKYREMYFNLEGEPLGIRVGHNIGNQRDNMFWARTTERKGPEGEKIMQVEEIQTDAYKNPELKKILPKDWKTKALHGVMKQAQDEGYAGVTFAKKPSQVAQIEKWSPVGNRSGVEFYNDNLTGVTPEDIMMDHDVRILMDDMTLYRNNFAANQDSFDLDFLEGDINEFANIFDELARSAPQDDWLAKENAEDIAARLKEFSDTGMKLRVVGDADTDDVANYDEGLQTVIKQYTEKFPQDVQAITGKPIGTKIVDGHELNYVSLTDDKIPDPVFFGTPQKVAAATAGAVGSGTASASSIPQIEEGGYKSEDLLDATQESVEEKPISLGQRLFPEVVPEEIPETPEKAVNEGWAAAASRYVEDKTGLPIKQITGAVHEMATGERRHNALPENVRNLPEFREGWNTANSGDPLTDAKISAGFLATPDPEQRKSILEANVPGVKFVNHYEDPANPVDPIVEIIMPNGDRSLLNKPGWSQSDGETLATLAAAFTPAGRVASTAAKAGLGMGNQMVRAGGAAMLTDAALQETAKQAGSGAEYDLQQGLIEGGLGAIMPPAGAAWRGLRGTPDPYVSTILDDLKNSSGNLVDPVEEVMKKVMPNALAGPE